MGSASRHILPLRSAGNQLAALTKTGPIQAREQVMTSHRFRRKGGDSGTLQLAIAIDGRERLGSAITRQKFCQRVSSLSQPRVG